MLTKLHLFDQKYSRNRNIENNYYIIPVMQCWIFSIITPVSHDPFRSHYNILIYSSFLIFINVIIINENCCAA